jgi:hypothetical protein
MKQHEQKNKHKNKGEKERGKGRAIKKPNRKAGVGGGRL